MPHNLFPAWRYTTRILYSGCDQAVYQQDVVVHRTWGTNYEETSGGLKIWHIYIGPNCRPDYGDLRFSDGHGAELAYYLWPDYTSSSARFAVRLEGADAAGALTVHYGNPSAVTTSNGDAAYEFFDHFDGTALDPAKWDLTYIGSHTKSVENSIFAHTATGSGVKVILMKRSGSRVDFAGSYTVVTRVKNSSVTTANNRAGIVHKSSPNGYVAFVGGGSPTATDPGLWGLDDGVAWGTKTKSVDSNTWYTISARHSGSALYYREGSDPWTTAGWSGRTGTTGLELSYSSGVTASFDYVFVRAYCATPPALLRTSLGVNPSYAGLVFLLQIDETIRFAGTGSVEILGEEPLQEIQGVGAFTVETAIASAIATAGTGAATAGAGIGTHTAIAGTGAATAGPVSFQTPIIAEGGTGLAYVAPTPVQFDIWQYRFESIEVSRSAQDALWQCSGQIDGLQAPLAYKSFAVKVPDHTGTLRTIFYGFVPGRDYIQAVAANKSTVQGFDAGFYLTRQYLPNGDLYYPAAFLWTPMNLIKYWLGEETTQAGSPSYWERVSGILPYRIHDPITYGHSYVSKDWNFQPKTTKIQAIQEVCEYSGMVFLVKWRSVNGALTPCAYLVHQDDIDDATHGLDLPAMVTFTDPDPCIANGMRATLQSDEKYNRIEVRSASPSGAWFHATRETAALQAGEELPIEYLEERSDLPIDADHYAWCTARADELYTYYTAYSYTYSLTLIDRTDLELYQRCQFSGFDAIPDGETMRIVAIRYRVLPTHTEVEVTVTPDSRLSDLRRLQRSQTADAVSETQTIAQSQIDQTPAGEVGTVTGIDGSEAVVELERQADSSIRGRIV